VVGDGNVVVAHDLPVIEGDAESTDLGSIEELELTPYTVNTRSDYPESRPSRVKDEPPGTDGVVASLVAFLGGAVVETAVVGYLVTTWLSIPLAVLLGGYGIARYSRRKVRLAEAWRRNHVTLTDDDARAFREALTAVRHIIGVWPRIRPLVDVSDPSPALARSLWALSEVLANRARVRSGHQRLRQAQADLPVDTRVKEQVDDRLTQTRALLAELDADVHRRMESLATIADECLQFVREQQAIARARDAVRHVDQELGSIVAAGPAGHEGTEELGVRTQTILAAYRGLTKDLGIEESGA
jgi:hypothetical protein